MASDNLEALLVDVGGTLVDDATWADPTELEQSQLRRLVAEFGEELWWFRRLVSHRFAEATLTTDAQDTVASVSSFLAKLGAVADRDMAQRVCRACAVPLHEVVRLAPGAREAIHAIRQTGVLMAVCSNTFWRGDDDVRRDWEEGFGIAFDGYVTSHDTGFGKPHIAMFERALASVAALPHQAAIIGDQLDRDIAGGRAAGLRTIWMHPGRPLGQQPVPDATVQEWAEVPAVIEAWRRPRPLLT